MGLLDSWADLIYRTTTRGPRYRAVVTPIGLTFWFGIAALLVFASLWLDGAAHLPRFVSPPASIALGVPLLLLWAALCGWTAARFFIARGSPVPLNSPQELVTTGLYGSVRNPMVAGWLVGMVGLGIVLGSISYTFIAAPLFALLNVLYLKGVEERELERKFGQEYLRYKEQVPMFIPRFRRRGHGAGG